MYFEAMMLLMLVHPVVIPWSALSGSPLKMRPGCTVWRLGTLEA